MQAFYLDLNLDIKNMKEFKDQTFDLIIDKACIDCLFVNFFIQCGDGA